MRFFSIHETNNVHNGSNISYSFPPRELRIRSVKMIKGQSLIHASKFVHRIPALTSL